MDRIGKIVVSAVRLAIEDSGLDLESEIPDRMGISIGQALEVPDTVDQFLSFSFERGANRSSTLAFQTAVPNAIASHCSIEYRIKGANVTSPIKNIDRDGHGLCLSSVKGGKADIIFAGGGDELSEPLFHVYSMLGALSPGEERE